MNAKNKNPKEAGKKITLQLIGGGRINIEDIHRNDFLVIKASDDRMDEHTRYVILDSDPILEEQSSENIILMVRRGIEIAERNIEERVRQCSRQITLCGHSDYKVAILGHDTDGQDLTSLIYALVELMNENKKSETKISQLKDLVFLLMAGLDIDPNVLK